MALRPLEDSARTRQLITEAVQRAQIEYGITMDPSSLTVWALGDDPESMIVGRLDMIVVLHLRGTVRNHGEVQDVMSPGGNAREGI
jgi:hypothetical protein